MDLNICHTAAFDELEGAYKVIKRQVRRHTMRVCVGLCLSMAVVALYIPNTYADQPLHIYELIYNHDVPEELSSLANPEGYSLQYLRESPGQDGRWSLAKALNSAREATLLLVADIREDPVVVVEIGPPHMNVTRHFAWSSDGTGFVFAAQSPWVGPEPVTFPDPPEDLALNPPTGTRRNWTRGEKRCKHGNEILRSTGEPTRSRWNIFESGRLPSCYTTST